MDLRTAVFSIRIWRERRIADPEDRRWRALIRDLGSRSHTHAETDEGLLDFVRHWRERHLFGAAADPEPEESRHDD